LISSMFMHGDRFAASRTSDDRTSLHLNLTR